LDTGFHVAHVGFRIFISIFGKLCKLAMDIELVLDEKPYMWSLERPKVQPMGCDSFGLPAKHAAITGWYDISKGFYHLADRSNRDSWYGSFLLFQQQKEQKHGDPINHRCAGSKT